MKGTVIVIKEDVSDEILVKLDGSKEAVIVETGHNSPDGRFCFCDTSHSGLKESLKKYCKEKTQNPFVFVGDRVFLEKDHEGAYWPSTLLVCEGDKRTGMENVQVEKR